MWLRRWHFWGRGLVEWTPFDGINRRKKKKRPSSFVGVLRFQNKAELICGSNSEVRNILYSNRNPRKLGHLFCIPFLENSKRMQAIYYIVYVCIILGIFLKRENYIHMILVSMHRKTKYSMLRKYCCIRQILVHDWLACHVTVFN